LVLTDFKKEAAMDLAEGTVGHKSHDPCFHEKYMEVGVMNFEAHCTIVHKSSGTPLLRGKVLGWQQ